MTKKPTVYHENPGFQSPIRGNRHSETQQANAARVRICRVSNLHAYVELTLNSNGNRRIFAKIQRILVPTKTKVMAPQVSHLMCEGF